MDAQQNDMAKDIVRVLSTCKLNSTFIFEDITYSKYNYYKFRGMLIAHNQQEMPHQMMFTAGALILFFKNGNFSKSL
tara:strand:- start:8170 stop:8400 length:231 start_codon:yes stop_codon:yes gene_type:complete